MHKGLKPISQVATSLAQKVEDLTRQFLDLFCRPPEFACHAPGRVNLIGEHTDYHEGFVMPVAIDLRTIAVGARRKDRWLHIRSENVGEEVKVSLTDLKPVEEGAFPRWSDYCLGVFWAFMEKGYDLGGADVLLWGNVPLGGGLSSSASLEVALAGLISTLFEAEVELQEVARLSETRYCRVPCGPMDQIASAKGKDGYCLLLDCRTLSFEYIPFPDDLAILVADSGIRHAVAGREYRQRQKECEEGLEVARGLFQGIKSLRDLDFSHLDRLKAILPETPYRRICHVVTENGRVLQAKDALLRKDTLTFGRLLYESHKSLATYYEVSCPELDALVEIASQTEGVIGARMTGAGFGGNCLLIVEAERSLEISKAFSEASSQRLGKRPPIRLVRPSSGPQVIDLRKAP